MMVNNPKTLESKFLVGRIHGKWFVQKNKTSNLIPPTNTTVIMVTRVRIMIVKYYICT